MQFPSRFHATCNVSFLEYCDNFKMYISPDIDQILAQLTQTGCKTFCSYVYKLINSILNKEELSEQWKESIMHNYGKGLQI